MAAKTYKALAKRVKITGKGKVMKRKAGQGHFNTREPSKVTRNKRTDQLVEGPLRKLVVNTVI